MPSYRGGFSTRGRNLGQTPPVNGTKLAITTQPSSGASSGNPFSQQPVIQIQNASSQAVNVPGVTVTASINSGSGTLGGTVTAVTNGSGQATFTNLQLTSADTFTLAFNALSLAGVVSNNIIVSSFSTPNILNRFSFEAGNPWGSFTNGGAGIPDGGMVRDTTQAAPNGGSASIKVAWTPNPGGDFTPNCFYDFAGQDRIFCAFWFKVTNFISTTWKYCRFDSANGRNTHLGGLFLDRDDDILKFGFDQEDGAAQNSLLIPQANIIDGNWHWFEMDYWRVGGPTGNPSVAFWVDNVAIILTGKEGIQFPGTSPASWVNGRMDAGERNDSQQLGSIEVMNTLNGGNTTTGQSNMDLITLSTSRIGPP